MKYWINQFAFVALGTLLGLSQVWSSALSIHITPTVSGHRLQLDSLRYANGRETISVSRLSVLLTDFELQKSDGSWVKVAKKSENSILFVDASKRLFSKQFSQTPVGDYRAIRFYVGPDAVTNHGDPARYPAKHALNPNHNQMHWDWQGGYIFFALEGFYRLKGAEHSGYVLHFANDVNRTLVTLPLKLNFRHPTRIDIAFDVASVLSVPQSISFVEGASSHSREGDPMTAAIGANLPSAFQVKQVQQQVLVDKVVARKKPLYLPAAGKGFPFKMSSRFPVPSLPLDNPIIEERVLLGQKLFHDKKLSRDHSISCASCHQVENAFADRRRLSVGVGGEKGVRNSMPLFNLAWKDRFFWDGRAVSLREQVLMPIADHKEMAHDLPGLVTRLKASDEYPALFAKAFQPADITPETIALALENFLLTLTSYDSKFDRAMQGKLELTDQEKRGFELFMTEYEPRSRQYGADCFHCHGGALFSDHQFHNNGLSLDSSDLGLHRVTGKVADKGKFATPSLRNIALTAPYMHDGRFKTLEEVLQHYNTGIVRSDTLDPNLAKHPKSGINLSPKDIAALAAFLRTLTDQKYLQPER